MRKSKTNSMYIMDHSFSYLCILLCTLLLPLQTWAQTTTTPYAPNQLLLSFPEGVTTETDQLRTQLGANLLKEYALVKAELWELPAVLLPLGDSLSFNNIPELADYCTSLAFVSAAQPNYYSYLTAVPNDPAYVDGEQWHLDQINAPTAWDKTTGSNTVIVATIDTGVDTTHTGLANNLLINAGETPNDGVDNDGNGYIDDYYGFDFLNNTGDVNDEHAFGHGTHVAGIIAEQGNDGAGGTGVLWQTKLLPIKIFSPDGEATDDNIVSAIEYAVARGAKVVNNSWGRGANPSTIVQNAIYAAGQEGVLFVAAAGNDDPFAWYDNDEQPIYPASYPVANMISVAASDRNDQLADFSHYGQNSVDLVAPGVEIYSTCTNVDEYCLVSGTSMAAPQVSAAAGLIWSYCEGLSVEEVKNLLLSEVDAVSELADKCVSGGRLNIGQAMQSLAPPNVTFTAQVTGAQVSFVLQNNPNQAHYLWTFGDGTSATDRNPSHLYATNGDYTVTLTVNTACGESVHSQNITISEGATVFQKQFNVFRKNITNIGRTAMIATSTGDFVVSTAGGYAGCGETTTNVVQIIKTNSAGQQIWERTLEVVQAVEVEKMLEMADGNYIVLGRMQRADNAGRYDFWLAKLDVTGNIIWTNSYNQSIDGRYDGRIYDLIENSDQELVIVGSSRVLTVDATGNPIWSKLAQVSVVYYRSIIETQDDHYLLTGVRNSDVYLLKINKSGITVWENGFEGDAVDIGYDVVEDGQGNYIVVGSSKSYGTGNEDVLIIKVDAEGEELWTKVLGTNKQEIGYTIHKQADGYLIGGDVYHPDHSWDAFLCKVDVDFNTLWTTAYNTDNTWETLRDVAITTDGYALIGNTGTTSSNILGIYWLKTDVQGQTSCSGENLTWANQLVDNREYRINFPLNDFATGVTAEPTTLIDINYPVRNICSSVDCPTVAFSTAIQGLDLNVLLSDEVSTHQWDFGDGNSSAELMPNHTYATAGTYAVCLDYSNGCAANTNCQTITVEATTNTFQRTFGEGNTNSAYTEEFTQGLTLDNGDYLLSGSIYHPNSNVRDGYIVRLDETGNKIWSNQYTENNHDVFVIGTFPTQDGYLSVMRVKEETDKHLLYVVGLDAQGDKVWTKIYNSSENQIAQYVYAIDEESFLIAGVTTGFEPASDSPYASTPQRGFLLKINQLGEVDWTNILEVKSHYIDNVVNIKPVASGGYWIEANTYRNTFRLGFTVDEQGNVVDLPTYNGLIEKVLRVDTETTLVATASNAGLTISKLVDCALVSWTKHIPMKGTHHVVKHMYAVNDQEFVLTGDYRRGEKQAIFWLKANSNGDIVHLKLYDGEDDEQVNTAFVTDDGGHLLLGSTKSVGVGGIDAYLIKTDQNAYSGCFEESLAANVSDAEPLNIFYSSELVMENRTETMPIANSSLINCEPANETVTLVCNQDCQHTAAFEVGATCRNTPITFINTTEGAYQYTWFIDGIQRSTKTDFDYTFTTARTYTVTLAIQHNDGCQNSYSQQIEVLATPKPQIATYTDGLTATYRFYLDGQQVENFWWEFEDGTVEHDAEVTKTYVANGNYTYCLYAENDCGLLKYCDTLLISTDDCVTGQVTDHMIWNNETSTAINNSAGDCFGWSVAAIGDLDGDGIEDLAVASVLDDDGGKDSGSIYILFKNYDGSIKMQQKISALTLPNLNDDWKTGARFGYAVTALGDINGDGIIDLAVGAGRDNEGGESDKGAVWILFLNIDGTVQSYQKINDFNGNFNEDLAASSYFGSAICPLGDFDEDGVPDMVVGSIRSEKIWICYLNTDGTVKEVQTIANPDTRYPEWGRALANVGDIDGDGVIDIMAGTRDGVMTLFLQHNGTLKGYRQINYNDPVLENTRTAKHYFGISVAAIGDQNGDFIPDIAVGTFAHRDLYTGETTGAVSFLYLNADGSLKDYQHISETEGNFNQDLQTNVAFGYSIAMLNNADGSTQLAVGAPYHDTASGSLGDNTGALYLLDICFSANDCTFEPDFTTDEYACRSDEVSFTNTTIGDDGQLVYRWLINNEQVSDQAEFNYLFERTGTHTIRLWASNGECTQVAEQEITIYPSSGDVALPVGVESCTNTAELSANVANLAEYEWTYNGNTIGTTALITVDNEGLYELTVIDACGKVVVDTVDVVLNRDCDFVWPGDLNNDGEVDMRDLVLFPETHSAAGPPRTNASTDFTPQDADDWNQSVTGYYNELDYKYSDATGDGVIDDVDADVVVQNYGNTHGPYPLAFQNYHDTPYEIIPALKKRTRHSDRTDVKMRIFVRNVVSKAPVNISSAAFSINYKGTMPVFTFNPALGQNGVDFIGRVKNHPTEKQLDVGIAILNGDWLPSSTIMGDIEVMIGHVPIATEQIIDIEKVFLLDENLAEIPLTTQMSKLEPQGTYMIPERTNTAVEWIDSVRIAGMERGSGYDQGYRDFTAEAPLTLVQDSNYTLRLTPAFSDTINEEFWQVWIDFDQNSVFEASERIWSGSSNSVITGDINIPIDALKGETRMRISMNRGEYANPEQTLVDGEVEDYTVHIVGNTIPINITAFLGAATDNGTMHTNLLDQNVLPLTQPYNQAPCNYEGTESVTDATAFPSNTVDWIVVDVVDANDPTLLIDRKAGLLLSDGSIVSAESPLEPIGFDLIDAGTDYHLVIRHRNHLPIRTANPLTILANGATTFDFTTDIQQTYHNSDISNAPQQTVDGRYAMWAGDADKNGSIQYNGGVSDRAALLIVVGTATPNNIVVGYYTADINMDGKVQYNSVGSDRETLLTTVGVSSPNNILKGHID